MVASGPLFPWSDTMVKVASKHNSVMRDQDIQVFILPLMLTRDRKALHDLCHSLSPHHAVDPVLDMRIILHVILFLRSDHRQDELIHEEREVCVAYLVSDKPWPISTASCCLLLGKVAFQYARYAIDLRLHERY